MPRPKQTYGKKAQESFTDFLLPSSSPLKQSEAPSSPLSSPPPSAPRRSVRKTRLICSDDEDDTIDGADQEIDWEKECQLTSKLSNVELIEDSEDELSLISTADTRTRSRPPLSPRDANVGAQASLIPPGATTLKAVVLPGRSQRRTSVSDRDASPCFSPEARRKRNIRKRKQRLSMNATLSSDASPLRDRKTTPTATPLKSPSFATRPYSPSLTFSVRPRKQQSQISSLPLPEPEDAYTAPLLRLVSDPTGRIEPTPFQEWSNDISQYFNITKLAEASYGEVYRLNLLDSQSEGKSLRKTEESVLKLISLKPPADTYKKLSKKQKENADGMSRLEDVAGEVRLLQRMTPVPGFTNFREIRVTRGRLPTQFIKAWHVYDREVRRSEFPDPSLQSTYSDDQLWAVIEMQDAGKDLEPDEDTGEAKVNTVFSVWDAFWSIACAASKGEEWAGFEHRDLHLGNVCIKTSEGKWGDWDKWPAVERLARKLDFTGLETTIIDYTLSRADMAHAASVEDETSFSPDSPIRTRPSKLPASPQPTILTQSQGSIDSPQGLSIDDQDVAFLNLSLDPVLFEGDASEEYQYEMYRLMRNVVLTGVPTLEPEMIPQTKGRKSKAQIAKEQEKAEQERLLWREHHPLTNLVWLHFVLYKLCAGVGEWPSELEVDDEEEEENKAVHKRASEIEQMLGTLEGILDVQNLTYMAENGGIETARDLVGWAVNEGWLDESDVIKCGMPKPREEPKKRSKERRSRRTRKNTQALDELAEGLEGVKLV